MKNPPPKPVIGKQPLNEDGSYMNTRLWSVVFIESNKGLVNINAIHNRWLYLESLRTNPMPGSPYGHEVWFVKHHDTMKQEALARLEMYQTLYAPLRYGETNWYKNEGSLLDYLVGVQRSSAILIKDR